MLDLGCLIMDYGERRVLDIPALQLREAGHYGLVGANGAGKTTLMRALLPRLKALALTMTPVGSSPDFAEPGYLPQNPYAFSFSVRRNIELGIPAHLGLSRPQRQALVERQLADFMLEDRALQRADRLSGGEAQKMALARLLVVQRPVLLLDEPTTGMDINSLQQTIQLLRAYLDCSPCLMVMVSHQLPLLRQLTDELLFLENGRLLASGPLEPLPDRPDQNPLQRFLGQWQEGFVPC